MYNFLISLLAVFQTSVYALSYSSIDGAIVPMNSFKGKKILIVNIATESSNVNQLAELERLQLQYAGQLVVIAFPSNSFAHENRSNAQIKAFCSDNYNVSFPIAEKCVVAGTNLHPVYKWLTTQSENGIMEGAVSGDYQKYLLDEQGNIVGVFAPSVRPLDSQITNAVIATYQ